MMRVALPLSLVFSVVVAAAGCESTVDLGGNVDAGADRGAPSDALSDAAAPNTCDGLCRKLRACGFGDEGASLADCIDECNARATEQDLACVARESCATIPSVCGGEPARDAGDGSTPISEFDVTLCKNGCRSAHTWDCIDAANMTQCQLLCETSSKRRIYADCANGSGSTCPKHQDCWNVFKASPP